MSDKNKFVVPENFLRQLNEFSGGGFILFIYDENQNPQPYACFDTRAHGLGMMKFVENWSEAVHSINVESTANAILELSGEEAPPPSGAEAGEEEA